MTIRYQVNYSDQTNTGPRDAGIPASLTIDLQVDAAGTVLVTHNDQSVDWIDVFYAQGDRGDFVLHCTTAAGVTPTINCVDLITIVQAAGAGAAGQMGRATWEMAATGTFDITFTQPESAEGEVQWQFNPDNAAPPVALKVVIRREP